MPSHIKNSVRMLPPFYSDYTTFWEAFGRATFGLNDPIRLSVFRDRLKDSFPQPVPLPDTSADDRTVEDYEAFSWNVGRSVGDLISGLCDSAQRFDPQMCYQYFPAGIRIKEWRSALATTMVNSIPPAIAVLLYKNTHISVEDDSEFVDGPNSKQAPENALTQRMLELIGTMQVAAADFEPPSSAKEERSHCICYCSSNDSEHSYVYTSGGICSSSTRENLLPVSLCLSVNAMVTEWDLT
ncbi:hypothetical protein PHPALM_28639 [Phytophthora palmivora]|uniref:Uncharacterized protein n=1 Tax=Phytophthora palmivora TaxID=4796 RepID=A0A2P4X9J8_9STRA|nr:hypothetical protein PHPALM_28639 [Phytophthora palmivora]